jgi:ABC-type dipeptide/oligopeptide/nickel transport system permease component
MRELFGVELSQGSLYEHLKKAYEGLQGVEAQIVNGLVKSPVLHGDETGYSQGGERGWLQVLSTAKLTYYRARMQRGIQSWWQEGLWLPQQFFRYLSNLVQGKLGESFKTRRAISDDLKSFLPATMELVIYATLSALIIGIPIGVLSASQRGNWFDDLSRVVTIAGVSIPSFWLAILLQLLLFSALG